MSDTERVLARAKLVRALRQMLDRELSFIEGSRIVSGLVEKAGYDPLSEPFVRFVAIDSETDAIPVGKVRDLWHQDAVAKHAKGWTESEAWARQLGEHACREGLNLLQSAA